MKMHANFHENFMILCSKTGNVQNRYIYIHFGASGGVPWGLKIVKIRTKIGPILPHFHHFAGMLIKPMVFNDSWSPKGRKWQIWGSRGPIWVLPGAPWIKLFPREYQGLQETVNFVEKFLQISWKFDHKNGNDGFCGHVCCRLARPGPPRRAKIVIIW